MKLYIRSNSQDTGKYGIFEAHSEVPVEDYNDLWDIVQSDQNGGKLIEEFSTLEAARSALRKYKSDVHIERGAGTRKFYKGYVYFVAELKDDDGDIYPGDGYDIR